MSALSIRELELFLAVAECLNFRLAAERLHMSQPPLSRSIRALEGRLGTRLFARNTHQVSLTPAGAKLLPQAQNIIHLLGKAEQSLQRYAAPKVLCLGLTSSLGTGMFANFITALEKRLHPVNVETTFDNSPRLVAQVKKQTLDVAIIAHPTDLQGQSYVELTRIPQVVAVASHNPLSKRRVLSLGDIANQPVYWFTRARQPAFFDHCHRVFRQHGFAPHYLPEPHDHHVLLAEVAAGNGVAILPRSFTALRLKGVAYRPLREGDEIAVGVGLLGDVAQHSAFMAVHEVAAQWLV